MLSKLVYLWIFKKIKSNKTKINLHLNHYKVYGKEKLQSKKNNNKNFLIWVIYKITKSQV